jgi:hypothetical protein
MKMMNNLQQTLNLLKKGREKLILDIVSYNRYDIYKKLFRHEKNISGQQLILEQYYTEWINYHLIEAFDISKELGCFVVKIFNPIIEKRIKINKKEAITINQIVPQILGEKLKILDSFMTIEDINEDRLNQLQFMIERDNAVFNRYLEEINEFS